MSTCRLRVLAGRRDALFTHHSDSVNPDTFGDRGSGQGRRAAPFDAKEALLETSYGEEIYI